MSTVLQGLLEGLVPGVGAGYGLRTDINDRRMKQRVAEELQKRQQRQDERADIELRDRTGYQYMPAQSGQRAVQRPVHEGVAKKLRTPFSMEEFSTPGGYQKVGLSAQERDAEVKRTHLQGVAGQLAPELGLSVGATLAHLEAGTADDVFRARQEKPVASPTIGLGTSDFGEYLNRLRQTNGIEAQFRAPDAPPAERAPTAAQEKMGVLVPRAESAFADMERFLSERNNDVPEESFLGKVLPGQYFTSANVQRYNQAADVLVNAILRGESGATITEDELKSYRKQFIPTPGDKPETVKQKLATLRTTLAQMRGASGGAVGAAPVNAPAPAAPRPVRPDAGPGMSDIRARIMNDRDLSDAEKRELLGRLRG